MRQRDRPRAARQRRLPLGLRQLPRGTRAERAQGLRDRSERAEVGAGADDDLRPAGPQVLDGLDQVAYGLGDRHPVGDVVAADHDDGHVRAISPGQRGQLGGEHAALRADHRRRPEPHRAAGARGDAARQSAAEGVLGPVRAQARGDGVAEDQEVHRLAVLLLVVPVARPAPAPPTACRSRAGPAPPVGCNSSRAPYAVPPATPPRTASATPARVRCLLPTPPVNQTHLNTRATPGVPPPNGTPHVGRRTQDNPAAPGHGGGMTDTSSPAPALATRPVAPQQLAWLRRELADWTSEGLIGEEQAARISAALPLRAPCPRQRGARPAPPRRRLRRRRAHLAGRRQPRRALAR